MTPFPRLAADAVALLHRAFVPLAALGGPLVWHRRRPGLAGLHRPVAGWGALVEFAGGICPLTPPKNRLRRAVGEAGFVGGFIDRYLYHYPWSPLYPADLNREGRWALGADGLRASDPAAIPIRDRDTGAGGTGRMG